MASTTMSATFTDVGVVVLGAGLAGISAAIFLQSKGVQVLLIDKHETLEDQGVETTGD